MSSRSTHVVINEGFLTETERCPLTCVRHMLLPLTCPRPRLSPPLAVVSDTAVDTGRQGPLDTLLPTLLGKDAEAELLGHRVVLVFVSRGTATLSSAVAAPHGPPLRQPHTVLRCGSPTLQSRLRERLLPQVGAERTAPTELGAAGGPVGMVPRPSPAACALTWGCGLGLTQLPWPRVPPLRGRGRRAGAGGAPVPGTPLRVGRGELVHLSFPG